MTVFVVFEVWYHVSKWRQQWTYIAAFFMLLCSCGQKCVTFRNRCDEFWMWFVGLVFTVSVVIYPRCCSSVWPLQWTHYVCQVCLHSERQNFAGRGPAYSGPQHWDHIAVQCAFTMGSQHPAKSLRNPYILFSVVLSAKWQITNDIEDKYTVSGFLRPVSVTETKLCMKCLSVCRGPLSVMHLCFIVTDCYYACYFTVIAMHSNDCWVVQVLFSVASSCCVFRDAEKCRF